MTILHAFLRRRNRGSGSQLDQLIAPEIRNDAFYHAIADVAARPGVETILEIGSSSGDGSTEAFVTGMQRNPGAPVLHCLEVSTVRYSALTRRWRSHPSVRCHNLSSVPLERFPQASDVERFYHSVDSRLNRVPLDTVLGWLQQDLDYIATNGLSCAGIRMIKESHGIDLFDAVLIDGSEFTGMAELEEVYGARFLLLDDIRTYKNGANYARLSKDPDYRSVAESRRLRNGYAIFERIG